MFEKSLLMRQLECQAITIWEGEGGREVKKEKERKIERGEREGEREKLKLYPPDLTQLNQSVLNATKINYNSLSLLIYYHHLCYSKST